MSKIWTLLGNLQNVSAAGGLSSIRLPRNQAIFALAFALVNSATGDLQAWSGTDQFRLKVNSRAIWDAPMSTIAAVQDARRIGPRQSTVKLTAETLTLAESTTYPLLPPVQSSLAGSVLAQTPAGLWVANFGQDVISPPAMRSAYSLNTGAKGIDTVDVEVQMGAYTSPVVQVWGWVDPAPVQSNETEVVTMIQTTSLSCQTSGLNRFNDVIPAKVYRSISFGNLTGATEGARLLVNRLEVFNTVDAQATNARKVIGLALQTVSGQRGAAKDTQGTSAAALQPVPADDLQQIAFDEGGDAGNLFNASGLQTDLTIQTASVKGVTMVLEYVGNPLVD